MAVNLDTLADHGVTAEFIFDKMDSAAAAPTREFMPMMLGCSKFDTRKILMLGLNKYREHLKDVEDWMGEEYTRQASDAGNYYSELINHMNNEFWRENRDRYYRAIK